MNSKTEDEELKQGTTSINKQITPINSETKSNTHLALHIDALTDGAVIIGFNLKLCLLMSFRGTVSHYDPC